jgi:hypothetical protein
MKVTATGEADQVLSELPRWELDKVDRLLAVLDEDIRHIRGSLSRLDELRSLVIKRDDTALARLLENIRSEADDYAANESMRQAIREELADAVGCEVETMTLSRLETVLPEDRRAQVADRKARLRALVNELRKEHISTAMLLSECARFNSQLLRAVFNIGRTGSVTYSPTGAAKRQTDTTLVNLQY